MFPRPRRAKRAPSCSARELWPGRFVCVATVCGADDSTLAKIKLAVREAATNAIVHAYRDGLPIGDVHVLIHHEDESLDISVRDDGIGMLPRIDSPGARLGLPLMVSLADSCEIYAPMSGGTEVVIRVSAQPDAAGGADALCHDVAELVCHAHRRAWPAQQPACGVASRLRRVAFGLGSGARASAAIGRGSCGLVHA